MKNNFMKAVGALFALILLALPLRAAEVVTFYHTDHLGSPIAASDSSGSLVWEQAYDPWGFKLTTNTDERAFTGNFFDEATGLSDHNARWYTSSIGRFMAIDPLPWQPSNIHSFNRYAYGNNNPFTLVDPEGLAARHPNGYSGTGAHEGTEGVVPFSPASPGSTGFRGSEAAGIMAATVIETSTRISPLSISPGPAVVGVMPPRYRSSNSSTQARQVNSHVNEGIYEFVDTSGRIYVGQSSNISARLKQHIKNGKLDENQVVYRTEVLGGKTLREVAEDLRIQQITGGVPARFSDKVSNKVDPIGPNRRHLRNE